MTRTYEDMEIQTIEVSFKENPAPAQAVKNIASMAIGHKKKKDLSPEKLEAFIRNCWKSGHHSIMEHVQFTFKCMYISRALLAQVTRQRTGKFLASSQHYIDHSDTQHTVHPTLVGNPDIKKAIGASNEAYTSLISREVPRSEARMVLPQSTCCHLTFTIDSRNLFYFLTQRLSGANVREMQIFAKKLYDEALYHFPELFKMIQVKGLTDYEKSMRRGKNVN